MYSYKQITGYEQKDYFCFPSRTSKRQHMRILQLCKKYPYPLKDGESIAVTNLGRALHELGCDLTLLAMNTVKHKADTSVVPEALSHYSEIHTVEVDNRLKPVDALVNLFSGDSYHISRFISRDFESKLIEILTSGTYDIIQLETLYLAPYLPTIRKYSKAMIAMRAHNVEHEIWERITEKSGFLPKKWYLRYLTDKLRKFEMQTLNEYDFLVAISERDLNKFKKLGYQNGAIASPVGIDLRSYRIAGDQKRSSEKQIDLFFIGSLDWMPNMDGLGWFMDEVWHKIRSEYTDVGFHVAGRNTPASLMNKSDDRLVIHGEIPDAHQFIRDHHIMIVPLFSGSGMRVKILEGMALGKTIITTSLGLEGIPARHGQEVLIADNAPEFIEAIRRCRTEEGLMQRLGAQAQEFIRENFDAMDIAQRLLESYQYITSDSYSHH